MANMTPNEQLMLELINRARMNPAGEAARYGIALNEGVPSGSTISTVPKQVLAGNDRLASSADKHSAWMNTNDIFNHFETAGTAGFSGVSPGNRMAAAGYGVAGTFGAGENIAFRGISQSVSAAQATQFIYDQHKDLFVDLNYPGRGHRTNILFSDWKEAGVGQNLGQFTQNGNTFNASMITENLAYKTGQVFVTGVVYNDTKVNDNFFTVGEQRVNVSVKGTPISTTGTVSDTTGAGGGYELLFTAGGQKTITFDGNARISLSLSSLNVKADFVNDNEVWANTSFTALTSNIKALYALGIGAMNLTSGAGTQTLTGNNAANRINGGADTDYLRGMGGKDILTGGAGATDADVFRFASIAEAGKGSTRDVITDFAHGRDKIDLKAIDTNASAAGDQAFAFHSVEGSGLTPRSLVYWHQGGNTIIYGDTNGNGTYDFQIELTGIKTLTASDFIL